MNFCQEFLSLFFHNVLVLKMAARKYNSLLSTIIFQDLYKLSTTIFNLPVHGIHSPELSLQPPDQTPTTSRQRTAKGQKKQI